MLPCWEQVKLLEGENGRYQKELQELQTQLGQEERKEEEARRKAFTVEKRVLECNASREAALNKVVGYIVAVSLSLSRFLSIFLSLSFSFFHHSFYFSPTTICSKTTILTNTHYLRPHCPLPTLAHILYSFFSPTQAFSESEPNRFNNEYTYLIKISKV